MLLIVMKMIVPLVTANLLKTLLARQKLIASLNFC
jgi:hypothetical protein